MKRLRLLSFAAVFHFLPAGLQAQKNQLTNSVDRPQLCGTPSPSAEWDKWFNEKVEERKRSKVAIVNYTIPVIVHVIYGSENVGTYPNISDAQIYSQIQVLNDDFAGKGAGATGVPTIWKNLVANSGISFCYAKTDPKGNPLATEGIDRVSYKTLGIANPTSIVDASGKNDNFTNYISTQLKPKTIWDPARYLNIWITDKPSGSLLLGFATFPAGSTLSGIDGVTGTGGPNNDGLWCWGKCFGTTGTLDVNYAKGRVSNHEIGHYLGLRHIWGDGDCATDYCDDTPPAKEANYNCPSYPANKGKCTANTTGEMTMNMMDYTNDPCKYMFTPDQVTRMQTAMANGVYRKYLGTHGKCSTAPQAPEADFTASKTYGCPGSVIKFTDESIDLPTSWSWTFAGGTPSTSSAQNPSVTYATPGVYEVKLVASNATGTDTKTRTSFITITSPTNLPLTEGFENSTFPPVDWTVNNIDYDSIFWQRTTVAGGFGKSSSSMVFDNYDQDPGGKRDEINTPKYDLTFIKNPVLTFDVAYVRADDIFTDSLAVLVSKDCGATFSQVYLKGGKGLATVPTDQGSPKFVPTSSQWRTETIDLNTYAGQANVMVVFQNRGHYAQPLYIDNVNITGTSTTSVDAIQAAYELTLSPNPTSGNVDLNFSSFDASDLKVEITNVLGQTINKELIKNSNGNIRHSFDISNQNAGIYFVS
ncbi:MAG TPA: M43 family zinc metalloprotease, partial [Bacteroidia bacterium]|nr:M43 family zinc metalloprotease [Bacteroidia bacterium]